MDCELPLSTNIKLKLTTPVVKGLFTALPYISENSIISFTKRMYGENNYPEGQRFIEKAFSTLKHVFKTANPSCKKAIVNNMIINEGIYGQKKRNLVTEKMGFDIPVLIVVSPTQKCPLRCYGCYAAEHSKSADLSYEAFDKLITDAKALGIYFFVISGGEPYIYDRIFDIFEKHSDAYFQTYTSAVTLAEKDHVDRIAKLGNVLPCISIEGFEEETDARRGKGHFKRILKAMAKLKAAGVPFGFSATATRENNDRLLSDELVDFYIKQGCCVGYYFQYMPIGRSPVFDLVPTPQQRIYRYNRILELRRTKPMLLADFWCDGPLVGGCLAGGRRYLHVNNLGHVEPCVFAQAYDMDIYKHSLAEVLRDSKLFKAIRRRQPYSDNLLRPCMIIDVPECWREAIEESKAALSYPTADNVAKGLREKIENFAKEYAGLADPIWEKEYKEAYAAENDYVRRMRRQFEIGTFEDVIARP
jgi:MoaA/NifB/PqqE/SkfB family radical SAM enzyme